MGKAARVYDRLNREIRNVSLFYKIGDEAGRVSMIEIRGKATFAYQLGLITAAEWESLIKKAFFFIHGG